MYSDTAALTFNHSPSERLPVWRLTVSEHIPCGSAHTHSLARTTPLHYATIGFAGGAPFHFVALASRTCWLSHFCRKLSRLSMSVTFLPYLPSPLPPRQSKRCKPSSNPRPKPLGGGKVSAGSHERDDGLPSKRLTAAGTERECALLTGTAALDIQSLVPKDCLSDVQLCR